MRMPTDVNVIMIMCTLLRCNSQGLQYMLVTMLTVVMMMLIVMVLR